MKTVVIIGPGSGMGAAIVERAVRGGYETVAGDLPGKGAENSADLSIQGLSVSPGGGISSKPSLSPELSTQAKMPAVNCIRGRFSIPFARQ